MASPSLNPKNKERNTSMKPLLLLSLVVIFSSSLTLHPHAALQPKPDVTNVPRISRPEDYREWVYLSSGLGMDYRSVGKGSGIFTNVFVQPSAYRAFVKSGAWPDGATFVVEQRMSSASGSINRAGRFQDALVGIGLELKDSRRYPEAWAYFSFGPNDKEAPVSPVSECWQCHHDHAAVEHTFVQFYPTLKPIALRRRTYRNPDERPATPDDGER